MCVSAYVRACVLTVNIHGDRKVFGWGATSAGQLGMKDRVGTKTLISKPTVIPVDKDLDIQFVACGSHHSVLLSGKAGCGEVWCGVLYSP